MRSKVCAEICNRIGAGKKWLGNLRVANFLIIKCLHLMWLQTSAWQDKKKYLILHIRLHEGIPLFPRTIYIKQTLSKAFALHL